MYLPIYYVQPNILEYSAEYTEQSDTKLNPTTLKYRLYYIKSIVEVRTISKNLDLDESVVLV